MRPQANRPSYLKVAAVVQANTMYFRTILIAASLGSDLLVQHRALQLRAFQEESLHLQCQKQLAEGRKYPGMQSELDVRPSFTARLADCHNCMQRVAGKAVAPLQVWRQRR